MIIPSRPPKGQESPQLVLLNSLRLLNCCLQWQFPHVMNNITQVRIAVAKLESTSLTPIFANIAVNAANTADNMAYHFHIIPVFIQNYTSNSVGILNNEFIHIIQYFYKVTDLSFSRFQIIILICYLKERSMRWEGSLCILTRTIGQKDDIIGMNNLDIVNVLICRPNSRLGNLTSYNTDYSGYIKLFPELQNRRICSGKCSLCNIKKISKGWSYYKTTSKAVSQYYSIFICLV